MEKIYTREEVQNKITNAINNVHSFIQWYEEHYKWITEPDIIQLHYVSWLYKAIEIIENYIDQE